MKPDRREFIKNALYALWALLGLGFLIPGWRVLFPAGRQQKEIHFFPLISEEEIPRAGVKKTELIHAASGREIRARVFIVSTPREVAVFSATCSHLGCLVNYRRDRQEFVCPCHGGRYSLDGKNIAGPPPAPLTRFPVRVQDGMVYVGVKA